MRLSLVVVSLAYTSACLALCRTTATGPAPQATAPLPGVYKINTPSRTSERATEPPLPKHGREHVVTRRLRRVRRPHVQMSRPEEEEDLLTASMPDLNLWPRWLVILNVRFSWEEGRPRVRKLKRNRAGQALRRQRRSGARELGR